MNVVERVKELTNERGWTKYRLAINSGLSHTSVANIFNRESIPSVPTIEILCKAYNISLSEFFYEADVKKKNQTDTQEKILLSYFVALNPEQKELLTNIAKKMIEDE